VHVVWIPKYRKAVLTGEVALRARQVIRQIAAEHESEIISGKIARDHVHVFLAYRPTQKISQIMQWLKEPVRGSVARVPESAQEVLGPPSLVRDCFAVSSGTITDEMILRYLRNNRASRSPRTDDFKSTTLKTLRLIGEGQS